MREIINLKVPGSGPFNKLDIMQSRMDKAKAANDALPFNKKPFSFQVSTMEKRLIELKGQPYLDKLYAEHKPLGNSQKHSLLTGEFVDMATTHRPVPIATRSPAVKEPTNEELLAQVAVELTKPENQDRIAHAALVELQGELKAKIANSGNLGSQSLESIRAQMKNETDPVKLGALAKQARSLRGHSDLFKFNQ